MALAGYDRDTLAAFEKNFAENNTNSVKKNSPTEIQLKGLERQIEHTGRLVHSLNEKLSMLIVPYPVSDKRTDSQPMPPESPMVSVLRRMGEATMRNNESLERLLSSLEL